MGGNTGSIVRGPQRSAVNIVASAQRDHVTLLRGSCDSCGREQGGGCGLWNAAAEASEACGAVTVWGSRRLLRLSCTPLHSGAAGPPERLHTEPAGGAREALLLQSTETIILITLIYSTWCVTGDY